MVKKQKYDVAIIGSGPAGGIASTRLAKSGLKTVLFEKDKFPRRKVCAGGVVKRALALLPDDLDYPVERRCDTFELRYHSPDLVFRESRDNIVTMVDRKAFDFSLVSYSANKGVEIFDEIEISALEPQKDAVQIVSGKKTFSASYVILAEGANARLANHFWDDDRELAPAVEVDVFSSQDKLAPFMAAARLDLGLIPGGYGWIFPKNDHLSVGAGIFFGTKKGLSVAFDDYLKKLGFADQFDIRNRKGFVIPVKPRGGPFMKDRILLTGDAAGFADPITAEGITYALSSGTAAADAVSQGASDEAKVFELYHKQIEDNIVHELNAALKFPKLIYSSSMLRSLLFRQYGERICRGMVDIIEGKRNYREAFASATYLNRFFRS